MSRLNKNHIDSFFSTVAFDSIHKWGAEEVVLFTFASRHNSTHIFSLILMSWQISNCITRKSRDYGYGIWLYKITYIKISYFRVTIYRGKTWVMKNALRQEIYQNIIMNKILSTIHTSCDFWKPKTRKWTIIHEASGSFTAPNAPMRTSYKAWDSPADYPELVCKSDVNEAHCVLSNMLFKKEYLTEPSKGRVIHVETISSH